MPKVVLPAALVAASLAIGCSSEDPAAAPIDIQAGPVTGTTAGASTTGAEVTAGGVSTTGTGAVGTTGFAASTTGAALTTTGGVATTGDVGVTTTGAVSTTGFGATTTGAGTTGAGTTGAGTTGAGTTGGTGAGCDAADITPSGAADNFSFFVTSWHHIQLLSGSNDGFGGDLRYKGAATGLEGADAICQEIACRVGFGHRTWKAFLSTSTEDASDRIGEGPWYDYSGTLVANDLNGLFSGENRQPGGCCDEGTFDELGIRHDGSTDVNNDGTEDDDHDTMTATNDDGTYAGFSCDDWTSVTAAPSGGGRDSGIVMGHSWPAQSGQSWVSSHGGHACAAGTNFIQNGPGDSDTVGGGGGYGGFYCFALAQ
jgi:hypothetical protein